MSDTHETTQQGGEPGTDDNATPNQHDIEENEHDQVRIPTPREWAQQQLANAPERTPEWARSVAAVYGFTLPD
ncbi:hypothetical protein GCM10011609_57310 [Lentzea pudingi]|uniref:Uncharacterized protein n=1 Tax=Lentzea pudingi TaxID=1789439 RepID=A0ABQ2IHL7_9PSEU|nr:hypothetical protein [Lentzea pudingi]GGN10061.1 hypothetical protein GCM10011609_57310 [Lentzea pudingi]